MNGLNGVNGLSTAQDGRPGAFHEQLTLGGGAGAGAHAPTMVDTPDRKSVV